MKKITILLLAGILGLTVSVHAAAQKAEKAKPTVKVEKESIAQKTCPVMGGKINKNLFYEYKGQKIYVCCSACIDKVKENPEKYLKKVKEDIAKAEKVDISKQQVCPVMGGKINKKLYYEYNGQKIYVCCDGCIAKIKENPEKYLKKVKEDIAKAEKKIAK